MPLKFNIRFFIVLLLLSACIPSLATTPPHRIGTQLVIFEFCEKHTAYKSFYQNIFFSKAHKILKRTLSTYSENDMIIARQYGYHTMLLIKSGNKIQQTILCDEQHKKFKNFIG